MNIGVLAFAFAVISGAASLIGAALPEKENRLEEKNYLKIYQAIEPKEI